MNIIALTGNATKDTELAYTESGLGIATGTIAVRRKYKNKKTNEYDTDFINWKKIGGGSDVMANHIKKGDKFGINGSLQIDRYEKDGQTKYFTEVIVDTFDFPDKPKQDNQQQQKDKSPLEEAGFPTDQDDLPFMY